MPPIKTRRKDIGELCLIFIKMTIAEKAQRGGILRKYHRKKAHTVDTIWNVRLASYSPSFTQCNVIYSVEHHASWTPTAPIVIFRRRSICHFCPPISMTRGRRCTVRFIQTLRRVCRINGSESSIQLTVVLIHMRAATLAPIATAPAVPPRMADFADLFIISENVGAGFLVSSDMVELLFCVLFDVCFMEQIDAKCFRLAKT